MSDNNNHISIREFARRVGCSDTSIRKAIKAGKIVKGIVYVADGRDKLDYDVAFKEWSASYDPSYPSNDKLRSKMMPAAEQPVEPTAGGEVTSIAKAKQLQAVLKVKMMDIELKEKQGKLVDKQQVYMALFEAGKEVKASIMAVPDRAIDAIFSAKSRNEAHTILTKALIEALDVLSEINSKPILDK